MFLFYLQIIIHICPTLVLCQAQPHWLCRIRVLCYLWISYRCSPVLFWTGKTKFDSYQGWTFLLATMSHMLWGHSASHSTHNGG